jgi:flagellar basal-body rod protein FlgB
MLENLFSPQLGNIQHAMERTTERQSLLMTNMANVNVPGYKRKDIDFHVALQGHLAEQYKMDIDEKARQDASDQTSLRVDGNNVDMEKEVGSVHETELQFEALTNMTTTYFSDLKSVIREGK